jgi:hypothetical protein
MNSMNDKRTQDATQHNEWLSVKDAYEEAGRAHRYFLSWRERLLAGYFALLSGLFIAYWKLSQANSKLEWMPFATGFLLTLIIWGLEWRNRDLYRACQQSAKECEAHLPSGTGIYTNMLARKSRLYHSTVFSLLFGCVAVLMLVGMILVLCGMIKGT